MIDLREKLNIFKLGKPGEPMGVMLPQAFIAKTIKACGMVPAGVAVIAERNVVGNFMLTYYDASDRKITQSVTPDYLDISAVYADALAALLAQISTDDLWAEIERRKAASLPSDSKAALQEPAP